MNSITSTRRRPCTSAECEPSGICKSRPTASSTPTGKKSPTPGLSISASVCVRPITVCSLCCASWTANNEASRPTKIGETMRGKTTRSRNGKTAASIMPSSFGSRFGIRYNSSVRCERVRSKLSSSSFHSFGWLIVASCHCFATNAPGNDINWFQAFITSAVTNIEPAERTMLPSFSEFSSARAKADSTGLTASDSRPAWFASWMIFSGSSARGWSARVTMSFFIFGFISANMPGMFLSSDAPKMR